MQTATQKRAHPSRNKKAAMSVFAHTACRLLRHYAGPKTPNYLPKTRACILRSDQVRSMSATPLNLLQNSHWGAG
jgi:hypothetical protein